MDIIPDEDLSYLKTKYHDPSDPGFNPFRRYLFHGGNYDFSTGLDDETMGKALREHFETLDGKPHPVVKAELFAFALDHAVIDVDPHDWFVGFYNWGRPLSFLTEHWKAEAFRGFEEEQEFMKDCRKAGAAALWPDFDHVIPDWNSLLKLGFPGLLMRSETFRNELSAKRTLTDSETALFDGISIALSAVIRLIRRYGSYAGSHPSEKGETVRESLARLENGAPETFFDALQCIYLYFMLTEHVDSYQTRSIGNGLDTTLLRFYESDLETGRFTKDELASFLGYFLMQFSAIGNYWGHPLYLGGTKASGETKINALSYEILRVYSELRLYNPKIQILYDEHTPKAFAETVLKQIRKGFNSYVFCMVPGFRKAMSAYASPEDAAEFEVSGCYESRVYANEVSAVVSYVNAVKPVLLVLSNGFDETLGKQFGPETGAFSTLKTFDDFLNAYFTQWDFVIEKSIRIGNEIFDPALGFVNPSLMYTATVESALKLGADGYAGGVKYNNSSILNCGFASAVDSLMAVKKLVYDEKVVTLEELKDALDRNFEGDEILRLEARNLKQKYGNSDPETDALARRLSDHFVSRVQGRPNGRGGIYKALMHSARMFIEQGKALGATPDGRRAGEELSKNASPAPGMDKNGATSLLHSALHLEPSRYAESFCLDVFLHPSVTEGEAGLAALKGILDVYEKQGGMAIQFNIVSPDVLRDAIAHPEKYSELQVRVCGWNVYWKDLSREEQEAYILRAEGVQP